MGALGLWVHRPLSPCWPASHPACPAPVPCGSEHPTLCHRRDRCLGGHVAPGPALTVPQAAALSSQHFLQASVSFLSVKNGDSNIKSDKHLTVSEAVISIARGGNDEVVTRTEIRFPVGGADKTFHFSKQREFGMDLIYFKPTGAHCGIFKSGIGRTEVSLSPYWSLAFLGGNC